MQSTRITTITNETNTNNGSSTKSPRLSTQKEVSRKETSFVCISFFYIFEFCLWFLRVVSNEIVVIIVFFDYFLIR